jgi:murein DD-endopeptidase MepM/ murein hydrolase activator NlpD
VIAGLFAAASLAVCYLPPVAAQVSVPYVQPACAYCPGHRGVEYALVAGTEVHAVAPGVVTFAGAVAGTRYVVVLQVDGLRATYGMLQSPIVTRGDVVAAGQVAGLSGSTLYFGLRDGQDNPIDPTPLLGRLVGRARLVPSHGGVPRRAPPLRVTCSASVSGVLPA